MIPKEILQRLQAHRRDTLALLEQFLATAKAHPGPGLAMAVTQVARAHEMLAEELEISADEAEAQANELTS